MTAPSPSDKIVDLSARTATGRSEPNALLAAIRARAFNHLAGVLAGMLDKADDTLFDFVQHGDGSLSNQDYFDGMRELRRQRPSIEERYLGHFGEAFSALDRRTPWVVDLQRSVAESKELSLVSDDQLEEQLGTSMLASTLLRQFSSVTGQIDHRIGIVAGLGELADNANPIGPAHIAYALRHALQPCDISVRIKVLLFKLYEREVGHGLAGFYNGINAMLVEAGVAPQIRPAYVRMPQASRAPQAVREAGATAAEEVAQDGAPAGSVAGAMQEPYTGAGHGGTVMAPPPPGMRYVPVPETAAERSIFATLHELLSGYRRIQAPDGQPAAASHAGAADSSPQMSANELLSVLSLFQDEMPAGLQEAVSDPDVSITQHIKRELMKGAQRLGVNPDSRMAAADEDSIDLVGMLFDVMLDERDFNTDSRQLIGRLIVPFVKVAMLDRRMFLQKTHPARRLLNALAEACEGNTGQAPQERELKGRVERTIDRLVAEFNEDITIFETLEQEFREFIEQHRRRVAIAERRTAEAQRGKERLEHARATSLQSLGALLERHPGLPPAIEAFLRRYWAHHLTLCSLRDEDASGGKYAEALASGEELVALATLPSVQNRADRLLAMRPRLAPILTSAGCTGSAVEDVLASLRHALGVAAAGEDETGVDAHDEQVAVSLLERNAPPEDVLPAPAPASQEVATPEPELEYDEADVERIRKLQVGAWIQFTEENGATVPAKLSWVSPISNRMLFVNRRGLRYCVASPEELAAMMGQNRVNIRQNDEAFEHAMSQVLGKLRSSARN